MRDSVVECVRRCGAFASKPPVRTSLSARSQFVRMPGGRRDNGKLQAVCYLDPDGIRLAEKTV